MNANKPWEKLKCCLFDTPRETLRQTDRQRHREEERGTEREKFMHTKVPILLHLSSHPFLHTLSRNCFFLFVTWETKILRRCDRLGFPASTAVFKDLTEES